MNADAILKFRNALLSWFVTFHRKLPWRETNDPYSIWVSEVMLQQTQVKKVIDYYLRFIRKFPTVETLATADQQTVLKLWEGLGYYSRARNLHRAAKVVFQQFDGQIPQDYRAFRDLPGVGDYIAAAVMSQSFDLPYPVVDGNVKRVISRIYAVETPINTTATDKVIVQHMATLLDPEQAGMFNQAVMELGAIICKPQGPFCKKCPVHQHCQAYRYDFVDKFPIVVAAKSTPEYHISVGIVYRDDAFLIVRRPAKGLLGGMWEFPGGRMEDNEKPAAACIRTIKLKTGLDVTITDHFSRVRHAYSHFKIVMEVHRCQYQSGEIKLAFHDDYRWIKPSELDTFPFHKAIHKFLPLLKDQILL
ncbi:A/G-specific adenine glycosylase [candidate division KSB1 bacterium]|nr:A/G-specific adenine glycosylase [candidate division KSB1 bacterium]